MRDGVRLAATLYLPDTDEPQPCLLEALPYRKDDLTSSYSESYRRLRDEFGFAVCRLDLRGTGSSHGHATDEYPAVEQDDLVEVTAKGFGQARDRLLGQPLDGRGIRRECLTLAHRQVT